MSSSGNSKTAEMRCDGIEFRSKELMRELVLWQVWGLGGPSDLDSGTITGRRFILGWSPASNSEGGRKSSPDRIRGGAGLFRGCFQAWKITLRSFHGNGP